MYLGDLGRDLPSSERPHWKLFNLAPDYARESETSFRRNRLAQWTEPTSPDLLVGPRLRQVNATWSARFGWPLFPELGAADAHSRQRLHIPLDESDVEFDEQVRVLSKLTIESINGLVSSIGAHQANAKPIQRLATVLATIGGSPSDIQESVLTAFNDLNDLNNGVRHRRGARWTRVAERLRLDVTPKTVVCSVSCSFMSSELSITSTRWCSDQQPRRSLESLNCPSQGSTRGGHVAGFTFVQQP